LTELPDVIGIPHSLRYCAKMESLLSQRCLSVGNGSVLMLATIGRFHKNNRYIV
jgi:hypothetical protein